MATLYLQVDIELKKNLPDDLGEAHILAEAMGINERETPFEKRLPFRLCLLRRSAIAHPRKTDTTLATDGPSFCTYARFAHASSTPASAPMRHPPYNTVIYSGTPSTNGICAATSSGAPTLTRIIAYCDSYKR